MSSNNSATAAAAVVPPQSLRKHRQTLQPGSKRPDFSQISTGLAPPSGQNLPENVPELPTVGLKDKEKISKLVKKRLSSRLPLDQVYRQNDTSSAPGLPENAQDLILEVSGNDYPLPPKPREYDGGYPKLLQQQQKQKQQLDETTIVDQRRTSSALTGPVLNIPRVRPDDTSSQDNDSNIRLASPPRFTGPPVKDGLPFDSGIVVGKRLSGAIEKALFMSADFDPKSFTWDKSSSATDEEMSKFADELLNLQERITKEKKDSMYSNYRTFLSVGAKVSGLVSELDNSRKFLTDFNIATTAMRDDAERFIASNNKNSLNTSININNTTHNNNPSASQMARSPSLSEISSTSSVRNGTPNSRSSMLMLEDMWQRELASLFKLVEGAQKFLPIIPGRHVIRERGGWYELNAATWKPLRPVHMFLLNDHLLIATKRRIKDSPSVNGGISNQSQIHSHSQSQNNPSGSVQPSRKLIADQCWSLLDVDVTEITSYPQIGQRLPQRALSIKATNGISFVYRAEKSDAHEMILSEFRKARDELLRLRDSLKRRSSHNRNTSVSSGGITPRSPSLNGLQSASQRHKSSYSSSTVASAISKSHLIRDIDQTLSDLDLKIAHCQFPEVVDFIEKNIPKFKEISEKISADSAALAGISGMSTHRSISSTTNASSNILLLPSDKLDQRISIVNDLLLERISHDYLSRAELRHTIGFLIRLGAGDNAKKTLLSFKHEMIRRRVKQVDFQGDIPSYILQVATISFQIIASTVEVYRACFPDPQDASTIVEWAKEEVDIYSMLFARQLHKVKPTSSTYQECYEITRKESLPLEQVGIDLSFMLGYIYDATKN